MAWVGSCDGLDKPGSVGDACVVIAYCKLRIAGESTSQYGVIQSPPFDGKVLTVDMPRSLLAHVLNHSPARANSLKAYTFSLGMIEALCLRS